MRAVIYARVSSEGDRQSTDRQVLDLRTYADKHDLEIVKEFTEKASGAKEDRAIMADCLSYLKDGGADILLVSEISRLGRTVKIVVDTIDLLNKAGVNVYIQDIDKHTLNADSQ